MKNFIPQKEEKFDKFCQNLLDYVEINLSIWGHIPPTEKQSIQECYREYTKISTARTQTQPQKKRSAKSKCSKMFRTFVNTYLRFNPVTNVDRLQMGVPNRSEN